MRVDRRRTSAALWLLALAALACSLPAGGLTPSPPPLPPTEPLPSVAPATAPPPTAPPATDTPISASEPTVIFHNGTILTMDDSLPQAQAIALQGDKILAVGAEAEGLALAGPATQVIDLGGLTLMPGFVDAHSHMFGRLDVYGTQEAAQQAAIENGITTGTEMYVDAGILDQIQSFERDGRLRLRLNLYLAYNDGCGGSTGNWYLDHPTSRPPGERLWISGIKIFSDGGSCNAPAVSFEFSGVGNGDLYFTQDELNWTVADLQARGYQVAIHTLGDRSAEAVLNAIGLALAGGPNVPRHRMDHNGVVRPEPMPRYGEIGIVPVLFGAFPTCFKLNPTAQFRYNVPEEYRDWEWPWRELLDANPGLTFAWHADAPIFSVNPFRSLYGFVTRNDVAEDGSICQAPGWLAANAITVDEALRMMTIGSAYATFRDEAVGSLAPGKLADLIVISDNPLAVEPAALKDIAVLMTMIGGQIEHCAPEHESLCPGLAPADDLPTLESPSRSNLALGRLAQASALLDSDPPVNAVDGNLETLWSAGADAPQWIEIDLGAPMSIGLIRLAISQFPDGQTAHRVWGAGPGEELRLLHEFSGVTADPQVLEFAPDEPWQGVQFVRVETVQSPSWVAWREIEIYAAATD